MEFNRNDKQSFLSAISFFSRELKLLLFMSATNDNPSFLIDWNKIDWDYFLELLDRHRLISFVYKKSKLFKDLIPADIIETISIRYQENTHRMLLITSEMIRIGKIISSKNIPYLFVKGPVWSLQLYGNVATRQSRDVDIFVPYEYVEQFDSIMIEAGYEKEEIYHTAAQKKYFIEHYHHFIYRKDELMLVLEVHWKLFNDYMQYPLSVEEMIKESDTADLGGFNFKILSGQHLIIYLFSHGAVHAWYRLFWLRDVAQLVDKNQDWKVILEISEKMKTIRPVIQGLVLSHLMFGSNLPESLDKYMIDDPVISKIVKYGIHKINETSARPFNMLFQSFYFSRLKKDLWYKIKCFTFLALKTEIWSEVHLPDSLFFVYYIVRPYIWYKRVFNIYYKTGRKLR